MLEDLGQPSRCEFDSAKTKLKLVDLECNEKQYLSVVLNDDRMMAESDRGRRLEMILALKTQMPSNDSTMYSIWVMIVIEMIRKQINSGYSRRVRSLVEKEMKNER